MTPAKLLGFGVVDHGVFTSHQEGLIARKTAADMKTARALAKTAIESKTKALAALEEKIAKTDKRAKEVVPRNAFETQAAFDTRRSGAKKAQRALAQLAERQAHLEASRADLNRQLDSGRFAKCYGGKKLMAQRKLAGLPASNGAAPAFASIPAWGKAWSERRDGNWLFEGAAGAAGANNNVKGTGGLSLKALAGDEAEQSKPAGVKIRLTETQAARRLVGIAALAGVPLAEASNITLSKHGKLRTQSEWIHAEFTGVKGKGHQRQFQELLSALKRKPDGSYAAPISWRAQVKNGSVYLRAQWMAEAVEVSFASNGCLGVDINGASMEWALCMQDGNRPSSGWLKAHGLADWKGSLPLALQGLSSNQALHAIRIAAKTVASIAASCGLPMAFEALDFAHKKADLRYGHAGRARQLSSFAYSAILAAAGQAAAKLGVETRWVAPAYTSVSGFAKFSSRFGLDVDLAAAFAIARKASLSKTPEAMGRAKAPTGWVAAAIRMEKFPGHINLPSAKTKAAKKSKTIESASSPEEGPLLGATAETAPQRMGKDARAKWRSLASGLGSDRNLWAHKLKAMSSPSQSRHTPDPRESSGAAARPGSKTARSEGASALAKLSEPSASADAFNRNG
jgi:hypothetical protein